MELTLVSTVYEEEKELCTTQRIPFAADGGEENGLINIYPMMTYQTFEGFGGALTESAGYIFNQMAEEQKEEMLRQYFDKEEMRYRMVRIPIDSLNRTNRNIPANIRIGEEMAEVEIQAESIATATFPLT